MKFPTTCMYKVHVHKHINLNFNPHKTESKWTVNNHLLEVKLSTGLFVPENLRKLSSVRVHKVYRLNQTFFFP